MKNHTFTRKAAAVALGSMLMCATVVPTALATTSVDGASPQNSDVPIQGTTSATGSPVISATVPSSIPFSITLDADNKFSTFEQSGTPQIKNHSTEAGLSAVLTKVQDPAPQLLSLIDITLNSNALSVGDSFGLSLGSLPKKDSGEDPTLDLTIACTPKASAVFAPSTAYTLTTTITLARVPNA